LNTSGQPQMNVPRRYIPSTDAEFQANITRPMWSDRGQIPNVDKRATRHFYLTNEKGELVKGKDGEPVKVEESLLMIYEMFTQDVRLGNLSEEELWVCREHIDLAQDLMQMGYKRAAVVIFERAICILETSHSKQGWFRKLLGTIRNIDEHSIYEPKKVFWSGGKKND